MPFLVMLSSYSKQRFGTILYYPRGVARIFQRGGGGGHTVSNIIVMAFSPRNIIGCLLKKKGLQRGVTGTPGPPSLRPCIHFTEEEEKGTFIDHSSSYCTVDKAVTLDKIFFMMTSRVIGIHNTSTEKF